MKVLSTEETISWSKYIEKKWVRVFVELVRRRSILFFQFLGDCWSLLPFNLTLQPRSVGRRIEESRLLSFRPRSPFFPVSWLLTDVSSSSSLESSSSFGPGRRFVGFRRRSLRSSLSRWFLRCFRQAGWSGPCFLQAGWVRLHCSFFFHFLSFLMCLSFFRSFPRRSPDPGVNSCESLSSSSSRLTGFLLSGSLLRSLDLSGRRLRSAGVTPSSSSFSSFLSAPSKSSLSSSTWGFWVTLAGCCRLRWASISSGEKIWRDVLQRRPRGFCYLLIEYTSIPEVLGRANMAKRKTSSSSHEDVFSQMTRTMRFSSLFIEEYELLSFLSLFRVRKTKNEMYTVDKQRF